MGECRRTVEQLAPYLDGLLSPAERSEVTGHLAGCPPCRYAADAAGAARTVLRARAADLSHSPLPPGLRSRCEMLAHPSHLSGAAIWRSRLLPLVAVAALILATSAAIFALATRQSDVLLAQQLTLDHMKCFHVFAPPPPTSVDAGATEAMLADRYGWNVHLPPSSPTNRLSLLGARRCLYASGTVPHVMYRVNGYDMSLFVLDGERRKRTDVSTLGYASRIWSRGAKTYVLVAPASAGDLTSAVSYVMRQVR